MIFGMMPLVVQIVSLGIWQEESPEFLQASGLDLESERVMKRFYRCDYPAGMDQMIEDRKRRWREVKEDTIED